MKKTYCDRCGAEMEQNGNILLRKRLDELHMEEYYDICDKCRDDFFAWLNNKPAEQEKPTKKKPAKKMLPAWATIKQLAAIFGQSERRMNRLMARTGANWWYEYQITKETYDYLTSKLS